MLNREVEYSCLLSLYSRSNMTHTNYKKEKVQNNIEKWNGQKLKGKLPHIPSTLSKLVVDDFPELVVSIPRNQMLCELDIENCKEVVYEDEADVMSLRSINISPAAEFQYLAEGFMQGEDDVAKLSHHPQH
ncbi:hypothetical protein FEM48_Zijuj05G0023300 [Ziziphus jujuba var. spinosa]|uniref:Uncharacterized protein n=1 Tax=Ziziphus jujuba var. spinosa TaxID=714518 RepID=A0A978VC89_ZIZJJ|nr:hypothetical protein FEM48_Zijuj05G0023300 [Ziziphus jujuba var. spinosa]